MSYNPLTDFVALLRKSASGVALAEMPGLDFVVAALARAGLISVFTGQTAPTSNQASTVWVRPSSPSWIAEASVFLWNAVNQGYEVATPALWAVLLGAGPAAYSFVAAPNASNTIPNGTTIAAIERTAPAATTLLLPSVASQFLSGRDLNIVDWSSAVVSHLITLVPSGTDTIMRAGSWVLLSSTDQLAGVRLKPVPNLNGWVIVP